MNAVLLITIELIILYILTRKLTQNLFVAWFLLTKSRPAAVSILSLLYFPGTIIHELAHMFVAEILQVHTSGLTLVPEGIENTEVRTGSVSITQTDPVRRAIIGVAPVFVGLGVLGIISYFLPGIWKQVIIGSQTGTVFTDYPVYLFLFLVYALFAVSNTMFSSPEDMQGFWPVATVLTLIVIAAYITGIRFSLTPDVSTAVIQFLTSMAISVGWVTGLNVLLFFLSKAQILLVEKVTKRRLVSRR